MCGQQVNRIGEKISPCARNDIFEGTVRVAISRERSDREISQIRQYDSWFNAHLKGFQNTIPGKKNTAPTM
jgi:hypothetical protein